MSTRLLIAVSQASANSFINFEMGKDVLKSISKVSSDAVFSNENNWKLVNFVFKHSSSSRRLVSSFRSNFESSKKTKLKTDMKIGDGFQLHKIIISKSDRSHLVIKRSEIADVSGFDFSLLADGPSAPSLFDTFYGAIGYNFSGQIQRTGGGTDWINVAYRSVPCGQDFLFSGTVNTTSVSFNNAMIGYQKTAMPLSGGSAAGNLATAAYFISQAQCNMYAGSGNTASTGGTSSWGTTQPIEYSIQRVSGVITCIVNGVTLFTDSYSGDVYLGIDIYDSLTLSVSATLVETPPLSALYTRDFVALNSQQGYEVISGSSSSPLVFSPSGAEFTCAFGATNTYANNDIEVFGLPNGTYKLKIYITSFSSSEMGRSMTLGLLNNSVNISYPTLLAAVGSFVEVEIAGSNLLGSLYYLQGVNCTIGISKIEILDVTFERNFLSPASQEAFENSATPFGTIQYAASGLRLIQAGPNQSNYQIYYTSPLSAYFPNSSQNYTVTVSYEVISIDAAFVFLKVLLGDVTLTMNSSDPRLSVGVHTNEVFTFNACNVQAGENSFQFWMNAQDNTEIKFFDYLIEKV